MNSSERFNQITYARNVITDLTNAYEAFVSFQKRWHILKMDTIITEKDFVNQHEGHSVSDLVAVFGASDGENKIEEAIKETEELVKVMEGDFGTALYQLRNF
jgi:hypothetical protein